MTEHRRRLIARSATVEDEPILLRWRNDPGTRQLSRTRHIVAANDHHDWLHNSLTRDDRLLLIIEELGAPAGVARWDRLDSSSWEISVTVAPESRGRGTARPLLYAAEAELIKRVSIVRRFVAIIHQDNVASVRLFVKSGYKYQERLDALGFATYSKINP